MGSDAEMCQIALGPSRTTLQCSKQRRGLKSLYIRLLSGSANVNAGRADKAGCIDEVSHKMHDIESSGGLILGSCSCMRCLAGGTIVKD